MKKYFTSLIVWGVIIVVFLTLGGGGLLALFLLLLLIYGIIELYKKVYMDIASLKLKKKMKNGTNLLCLMIHLINQFHLV